jgi:ADP-ribose pyrophosphatase
MIETRDNEILFRGLVVEIEHMEVKVGNKGWHPYQIIRHPGGVAVVPLHNDGTVTLIRQLRPAVGEFLLELPAGRLSPGETPETCGRRELLEETGLSAERFQSLGSIHPTPGICDERIHLYLATGLTQGEAEQEPYEDIEVLRLPFDEVLALAEIGAITDSKTVAALFRASRRAG